MSADSDLDSSPLPRRAVLALVGLFGGVLAALFWPFRDSGGDSPGTQTPEPTPSVTPEAPARTPIDQDDGETASQAPAPDRLAQVGYVVPVGPSVAADAAIDPATTPTPVQDAIDAIGREREGVVLLPPGRIEERGPVVGGRGKTIAGWGMTGSEIAFTDDTADGIAQDPNVTDDWRYATITGVRLSGNGPREAGSAIHFDVAAVPGFTLDGVDMPDWRGPDPIVHADGGHWFDSVWQLVKIGNTTSRGTAFQWDNGGSPNHYTHLTLNPGDDGDGKAMEITADIQATIGSIEIVTQGSDFAAVALTSETSQACSLTVETLNYEADQSLDSAPDAAVVHKAGPGYLSVGKIQVQQTEATVNHGFTDRTGDGHWRLGSVTSAEAPNAFVASPVRLHRPLDGRPAMYGGTRADLTDENERHGTGLLLAGENYLYHGSRLVGSARLSRGRATILTGVTDRSATFDVAVGVASNDTAEVTGHTRWSAAEGQHVAVLTEAGTDVGNPRVNYHLTKRSV